MKKLSAAQLHALAEATNYRIGIGTEGMLGVSRRSLESLERLGFVKVIGSRKPYWHVSDAGRDEVVRLIADGSLKAEGRGAAAMTRATA